MKPRSIETGLSSPGDRPSCRGMHNPRRTKGESVDRSSCLSGPRVDLGRDSIAQAGGPALEHEPDQQSLLEVEAIRGLGDDHAPRAIQDFRGHLLATVGGEAMEENRLVAQVG